MTVKELIKALQQFPEDTFVYSEMKGYCDPQYGLTNIQGSTSHLEYNETEDLLHLIVNFDIATSTSY